MFESLEPPLHMSNLFCWPSPIIPSSGFASSTEKVHHFSCCPRASRMVRMIPFIFIRIRKLPIILLQDSLFGSSHLCRRPRPIIASIVLLPSLRIAIEIICLRRGVVTGLLLILVRLVVFVQLCELSIDMSFIASFLKCCFVLLRAGIATVSSTNVTRSKSSRARSWPRVFGIM